MQSARKEEESQEHAGWGGTPLRQKVAALHLPRKSATPSLSAQPSLTEGTFHPPRQPDLDTKDTARQGENPGRADTTFPPFFFFFCQR